MGGMSNGSAASGDLFETDLTDQVLKESRIEALRSLLLILVREMDSLKQMVVPNIRERRQTASTC